MVVDSNAVRVTRLALFACSVACSGRVLETAEPGDSQAAGGYRPPQWPSPAGGVNNATQGGSVQFGTSGGLGPGVGGASACPPGQWVLSNQVINARDLGGVRLSTGLSSACGKVFRGGPLANLTQMGCEAFHGLGIRTVIDLRTDSERIAIPDASCVFAQSSVIWAPLPIPYSLSPAQYIADLDTYSSVRLAFETLGDAAAYPVYFHCTYGRDRTGVLAAVILLALGASHEDVLSEYQLTALSGLYVPPDSLSAVLDDIELRGGIQAYLDAAGVPRAMLAVLRSEAVGQ